MYSEYIRFLKEKR